MKKSSNQAAKLIGQITAVKKDGNILHGAQILVVQGSKILQVISAPGLFTSFDEAEKELERGMSQHKGGEEKKSTILEEVK